MKLLQYIAKFSSRFLLTTLTVLTVSSSYADKTKSALKALERGEFEKVEEILQKSLIKEVNNPGSKFLYSILFAIDSFARYNIDSAHYYILSAEKDYESTEQKELVALTKNDITPARLKEQHDLVDSIAFLKAKHEKSLAGYNHYIQNFSQSVHYDSSIFLRNQVAFNLASQEASWQSYKDFIDKYPDASDLEHATREYDRLIFEEKTKLGGLTELENFLKNHPNTPYKGTIEKRIFRLLTHFGEPEKILHFINTYQHAGLRKYGMDILYHLHHQNLGFQRLLKTSKWRSYADSLKNLNQINSNKLIPFMENRMYGFMDVNGNVEIELKFNSISKDYLCGQVKDDVLDVVVNNNHMLINRMFHAVYKGEFDSYNDLGGGIIEIIHKDKSGVYHKSGKEILPSEYQEIMMLSKSLLRTQKSGKYGVTSIFGKKILEHKYDDIYLIDQFLIFEKGGRVSINLVSKFLNKANNDQLDLKFEFDDFEIIDNNVICFDGDQEVLLDSNLEVIVPKAKQRINTKFDTWVIAQSAKYRLFNKETGELKNEIYEQVIQNRNWLAVKRNGKWSVYSKSLGDVPIVGLDSVNLLGEDISLVFRRESGMAIFPNKKIVEFSKNETLSTIGSGKNLNVHFLVIARNKKNILFKDGQKLFESEYEIGYISENVFSAKRGNKYGAMDSRARLIMRVRYDAIGEAENGIAPVLFNGKFGAYNFNERILINLKFDEKLKRYNDQLLIVKSEGKKGLQSIKNTSISGLSYDEILFWSDSTMFTKQDNSWSLVDIYSGREEYSGILDFEFLSKDQNNLVMKFRSEFGLGIYSSLGGLVIKPSFNDIINLGDIETPLYFCEKAVVEANYYAVVYKNGTGETLRTQAYRDQEYDEILCDR